ncbi:hypothetical protein HRI_000729200 [Hibiscus trionum]|uniref:MADS-box domain-containing protein n=1 Tax=Hibiscus trionum TaxID=183268 RepID=A0A9W7H3V9_HIBTR|nr:hypothetical protein HRI_000729200 [Hibiscus trionum]
MAKKNLGRQKIEMVKMTNESNLNVTFSKRRAGLFKKASELSTLCGVELAIVVFSPAKRVYSFGHPSVDTVIDRYLGCNAPETSITSQMVVANRESNIHQLNMELTQIESQLEAKKKLGEELNQIKKANQQQCRWQSPIEELDLSQLQQLKSALEVLKKKVQAQMLALLNANPHQFYEGSSSGANNINMAFDASMMDGGYIVPGMTVPPTGLNPTDGYIANPAEGYSLNPTDGYIVNPAEGYSLNPTDEYIVNPAEGYSANPAEGFSVNPSEGYNINPSQGYNVNPQGNDVLDPLNFGTQGFGGGAF